MIYIAHKTENNTVHTLKNHLLGVKTVASNSCMIPEYTQSVELVALLHDLGKLSDAFQKYITEGGRRGSVKHAIWGAMLAYGLDLLPEAFSIAGHHAGIPNNDTLENSYREIFADLEQKNFLQDLLKRFFAEVSITMDELKILSTRIRSQTSFLTLREKETAARYVFSCLVDADWLDTEQFMDSDKALVRKDVHRIFDCDMFIFQLENDVRRLQSEKPLDSKIGDLREKSRLYAVSKASLPLGFFSLTLPTGLGKTITSVHWALEHAKTHELHRIIIVLPYTNIIDQTAEKLKNMFGAENVLEHHSTVLYQDDTELGRYNKKQLATENWDYPIIVTSTVQFFESLFSNKPSKCRKIHHIAKSVVIFDEVQSLEKNNVLATIHMLIDSQKVFKSSYLFCTATQPAFYKRKNFDGIPHITPLAENPSHLFSQTKRVQFQKLNNLDALSIESFCDMVCSTYQSTLIVVNAKKTAVSIYSELCTKTHQFKKLYHLSTNMYPAHRKKIIADIHVDLQQKTPILLVSTQLIEAGVDLDFDCAYREIAPLSSIIQTAGRCNREGQLCDSRGSRVPGNVYIFALGDAGCPSGQYETEKNHTKTILAYDFSVLDRHDYFSEYYEHIINLYIDKKELEQISRLRENLQFQTVADCYRVIDSPTQPLFICADFEDKNHSCTEFMEKIRGKIRGNAPLNRNDFRILQQYVVQVYPSFLKKAYGHYAMWKNEYIEITVWESFYDTDRGIYLEETDMSHCIL